jgi:hypothetical protein
MNKLNCFSPNLIFLLLILIVAFSFACNNQKQTKEQSQDSVQIAEKDPWADANLEDESDPFKGLTLEQKVNALLDSIDIQWYAWNKSDDERRIAITQLIQELGKLPKINKATLDSVKQMQQKATQDKLTQENMMQAKRIDNYDENMISMVEKLSSLMTNTPNANKCDKCLSLISQIKNIDENEFILRKTYDDNVFILNDLIEKEKSNLEKLGDKYKNINKLPVFAIISQ